MAWGGSRGEPARFHRDSATDRSHLNLYPASRNLCTCTGSAPSSVTRVQGSASRAQAWNGRSGDGVGAEEHPVEAHPFHHRWNADQQGSG